MSLADLRAARKAVDDAQSDLHDAEARLDQAIADGYTERHTIAVLSDETGRSRQTIYKALTRAGLR